MCLCVPVSVCPEGQLHSPAVAVREGGLRAAATSSAYLREAKNLCFYLTVYASYLIFLKNVDT